ncbi:integrase [Dictyobacter sp. S3.2.2.5]|uniref:Integrase n=1 Tax=Dictyobacter halimunensis TaxID=3026934 RepID=A0ABQ6FP69_9CHLR|nr:integrase [Dictyobacter sp. S3.2.2.5]GLV54377.1 integrase [Dictyobacter sp. S3.2.2.5]GLV56068.1 integrase [Dictyobacter sp. S3.2.2.5]GLV56838.1 integrase [Dictyobacter sp. S3.2.2.5]
MELGRTLCASGGPINKTQLARALGIARSSLYLQLKRPQMDKQLVVAIEGWQELDDTLGHRKLAKLINTGKNRVKRVMHKYGIAARRKKKKYVYPGKATQTAPNLVRDMSEEDTHQVIFSDIFEVHLADQSRVRGCFALEKQTRQIFGLAFDYHMRADLVTSVIETMTFPTADAIWHSDQGKQYGAQCTRDLLLQKGFLQSMSRAGTPTDNGYAERFVGTFKLAVADRRSYHSLGHFLGAAEAWINFYNTLRPHEGVGNCSPLRYAQDHQLHGAPLISL